MIRANDPSLRSWIDIAPESDFPLQNLPFGVFQTETRDPRVGVAIGPYVLDLYAVCQHKLFELLDMADPTVFHRDSLNDFLALGRPTWREVRNRVSALLRSNNGEIRDEPEIMHDCLLKMSEVEMLLPVKVANLTNFPNRPVAPAAADEAWLATDKVSGVPGPDFPFGIPGRASSVVVSGTGVHRPQGLALAPAESKPVFKASAEMDFELELAFVTGQDTPLGSPVDPFEAEECIFGLLLFNNWAARDMQRWEQQVQGFPFLSQSFASSVSPWVVTLDALEPFRVSGPEQKLSQLAYLTMPGPGHFDIQLEALLQPENQNAVRICTTESRAIYWSMIQLLAHQTSNGCNLQVGDLYAMGGFTDPGTHHSLQEVTQGGTLPLILPDGSERQFLRDGDSVLLRAFAEKDGLRIGFGEVRTKVLPAGEQIGYNYLGSMGG